MKTLLFIFCILFSISCYSQHSKIDYKNLDQLSKLEYQNDYTRYCLKKYHDEKSKSYKFQLVGLAIISAGIIIPAPETEAIYKSNSPERYTVITKDYTIRNIASISGSVVTLVGIALNIDAEKWTKRAYIGPNGIGVRFRF